MSVAQRKGAIVGMVTRAPLGFGGGGMRFQVSGSESGDGVDHDCCMDAVLHLAMTKANWDLPHGTRMRVTVEVVE